MARLLTGEFNDRAAAESTIEDLVRAGVPREQIYIETELPPDTMRGRKGGEVEMAEAERRIAGTETGFLVGSVLGLLGGMLAATINEALVIATQRGVAMGWPFSLFWASALMGLLIGALTGAALGYTVDFTLNRIGAGPARAREECLVTVRADDQSIDTVRGVFFDHRARHVLGAEIAA
jgi:hypothetical protein